jgi:hypothetical protein
VVLKLNFEDSNTVVPRGENLLEAKSNYFNGQGASDPITDIPNYGKLVYNNIYENIDLVFENTEDGLKYEYIVHPGGNPSAISMRYEGANEVLVESSNELKIYTASGVITDSELLIYQNGGSGKNTIEGQFDLQAKLTYGFAITGDYDKQKDLIIDPLLYSTFLGGKGQDAGLDIDVDDNFFAYATGYTRSPNYPTTTGAYDTTIEGNYDVFVTKLKPDGSGLVYSTFVGGELNDLGWGIEVDSDGCAFVTGSTNSDNFPTTPGAYDTTHNGLFDVFVFKLKDDGSGLIYSTYVGGKKTDLGFDIAIDSDGNAFVTGGTNSPNFPTTPGAFDTSFSGGAADVFVFDLKHTGADIIYSTFVGGSGYEIGLGIKINSDGDAFVTGFTASDDFPVTAGAFDTTYNGQYDVFVFKLRYPGVTLTYSTYVGGTRNEWGLDIVLDSDTNAFVTGFTNSWDFPVTVGPGITGGVDVFVFKLKKDGASMIYSRLVGGTSHEGGYGITLVDDSIACVTGFTMSADFPVTATALDTSFNGGYDVFVFVLDSTGTNVTYSTFVGGDNNDLGMSITVDTLKQLHVTGYTNSQNFPTTAGAFDTIHNGLFDAFVFKLGSGVVSPSTAAFPNNNWVLGQYPRHTWVDFTTMSVTGATVHVFGTVTMGTLKQYIGTIDLPPLDPKTKTPRKISLNVGEFCYEKTSDPAWLTGEWYYLEVGSKEDFMVVFSRSVLLEGSHVTHADQILSKPPEKHNTDWWFTNGGSLARDDKVLMYTDELNLLLKFKDRVVNDHYPIVAGSPNDAQLPGYSSTTFTGLHLVDAKDIIDNKGGLYSFHSHACYDYAIGVFDQFFNSDDGDKLPSTAQYKSDYYHGWYGLDKEKPRFIEVKDRRIYAEQPAEELWGVYTPNNKLQYEDINGAQTTVDYLAHGDTIHRDTVYKNEMALYPAGKPPYYVDVSNVAGGSVFSSDLPAADEVIAHRATYFGYDPVVGKLQIANPYDCDVYILVLNRQNLQRVGFTVPAHSVSVKDLYYDATFDNFFDPISTGAVYRPGIPDHAFIIEVGAFIIKYHNDTYIDTDVTHLNVSKVEKPAAKVKRVDVFQKVTDTCMLRQYNRMLMGTYDDDPCKFPDEPPTNCTVDTPVIKPPSGCYDGGVNVTITTTTAGATIYYTTDGTEPTTASNKYTGSFYLHYNDTVLLRAKAFKDGCEPSGEAVANYTHKQQVATPVISPNGGNYNSTYNVTVTITCSTPGATIYYRQVLDWGVTAWEVYTGPLSIYYNVEIQAYAVKNGCWEQSGIAKATFYFYNVVATPVITPAGGNYSYGVNVSISCSTSGAVIYYTLDGSEPTQSSNRYYYPFYLQNTSTLKAKAYKTNWTPSNTATAYFLIYYRNYSEN